MSCGIPNYWRLGIYRFGEVYLFSITHFESSPQLSCGQKSEKRRKPCYRGLKFKRPEYQGTAILATQPYKKYGFYMYHNNACHQSDLKLHWSFWCSLVIFFILKAKPLTRSISLNDWDECTVIDFWWYFNMYFIVHLFATGKLEVLGSVSS